MESETSDDDDDIWNYKSECPAGLSCDDTISTHYRSFRHSLLAKKRAGLDILNGEHGKEDETIGLGHAKRKLQFSSSKKCSDSVPSTSSGNEIETSDINVGNALYLDIDVSVDQAKRTLSFPIDKFGPSTSIALSPLTNDNSLLTTARNGILSARHYQQSNPRDIMNNINKTTNSFPTVSKSLYFEDSDSHSGFEIKGGSKHITDTSQLLGTFTTSDTLHDSGSKSDEDIFNDNSNDDEFYRDVSDMLTEDSLVDGKQINSTDSINKQDRCIVQNHVVEVDKSPSNFGVVSNSQEVYASSQVSGSVSTRVSKASQNFTESQATQRKRKRGVRTPFKKDPSQLSINSFFKPKTTHNSTVFKPESQSTLASYDGFITKVNSKHDCTDNTLVNTGRNDVVLSSLHKLNSAPTLRVHNTGRVATNTASVTRSTSTPLSLNQAGPSVGFGDVANGFDTGDRTTSGYQRKCPFYKKMPGTPFTVDAFGYGTIPGCSAYFLTHFHYDHYGGLKKSFAHSIYCTKETANLVEKKIRVQRRYLNALPLNTPTVIHGVEVTFMDANHCPGSVMILFKLRDGRAYLHTGDFRATEAMQDYTALQGVRINQLYLDTTYCDPSHAFPPQDDVIRFAVSTAIDFMHEHPNGLIAVGSYTIGKERVFMAIAEALNCRVCVAREKKNALDCLEDHNINKRLTLQPADAKVHVLAMRELNYQALTGYLAKLKPRFDCVLAFEPTGWTHSNKLPSLDNIKPKYQRAPVTLYGVPYSEHSSYTEMKLFCQYIKADQILPTVNNGSAQSRHKMEALFQRWMTEAPSKTFTQKKLGAFFAAK